MAPHIMSRWAPASEPPITARGIAPHLGSQLPVRLRVDACLIGRSPVRSSSATTMSSSSVEGIGAVTALVARSGRPSGPRMPAFSGANVSIELEARPLGQRRAGCPASSDAAPSFMRRRTSGSRQRLASARAPAATAPRRQPGSPSSTKPDRNDRRRRIECGSVERHDAAAALRGVVRRGQLALVTGRVQRRHAEHVPVQRPVGGHATSRASRSRSSAVNPLRQPARIASSVVPGASRTAPASATSSSSARRP